MKNLLKKVKKATKQGRYLVTTKVMDTVRGTTTVKKHYTDKV